MKDRITIKEIKNKFKELEKLDSKLNFYEIDKYEFSKYTDLLEIFNVIDKSIKNIKLALPCLNEDYYGIKIIREVMKIHKILNLKSNQEVIIKIKYNKNKFELAKELKQKLIDKLNSVQYQDEEEHRNKINYINEELKILGE